MAPVTNHDLIGRYHALPGLEQGIVQLASVIYTGEITRVFWECMRDVGPAFFGWKTLSQAELDSCLKSLREAGFLDEQNKCHPDLVETATRHAASRKLSPPGDLAVRDLVDPDAWTENPGRCVLCLREAGQGFSCRYGLVCLECSAAIVRDAIPADMLSAWPRERILHALGPDGAIEERITALSHARSAVPGTDPGSREICGLLVENLGYVTPSPTSRLVRQLAMSACLSIGKPVMPFLLEQYREDPWQLAANCLLAISDIDPEGKGFQKLLLRGLQHKNPQVRIHLARSMGDKHGQKWAQGVLSRLSRDPHRPVREAAIAAIDRSRRARPSHPGPASPARGFFLLLADAAGRRAYPDSSLNRRVRDLRIEFYADNGEGPDSLRYHTEYLNTLNGCVIAQICNTPFDREWFGALDPNRQVDSLYAIFDQALFNCMDARAALAYAMEPGFLGSTVMPQERVGLWYRVATVLLVSGRVGDVERLIDGHPNMPVFGIRGWIALLRGDPDAAAALSEADLDNLGRQTGKKRAFFHGYEGLFFILALVLQHSRSGDTAPLDKALAAIEAFFLEHPYKNLLHDLYECLKATVKILLCDPAWIPGRLPARPEPPGMLGLYFYSLACVVAGTIGSKLAGELRDAAAKAGEAGMHWLALELDALLKRAGAGRKKSSGPENEICQGLGVRAVAPEIRAEDPWKRGLKALIELDSGQEQERDRRLVWHLSYRSGAFDIQPREQKPSKRGAGWTSGRAMKIHELTETYMDKHLDARDRKICRALRDHVERRRFTYSHESSGEHLMVHLIGHPRVFMAESPKTPLEILGGEPEIMVHHEGEVITIRPSIAPTSKEVVVIRESPVRFRVIELDDAQHRVLDILGKDGMRVPQDAVEDVLQAIRKISSVMTVQSSVGCASGDVERHEADPRACIHLLPSGRGFRMELFVRPFGDAGPYLKPGTGGSVVITEFDGKRHQADRDLQSEQDRAREVMGLCSCLSFEEIGETRWLLADPADCLQVLASLHPLKSSGRVRVEWPKGEKLRIAGLASFENLRLSVRGSNDWFEIDGELQADGQVLDLKLLLDALERSPARFIPLDDASFLALADDLRRLLGDLGACASSRGETLGLHPLALFSLNAIDGECGNLEADPAARARLERFRQARSITPEVPSTLRAELREYQRQGFEWLARLAEMGMGACLADDMGLGKTIQALAVLLHRTSQGPALVVAPTSVCMNWVNEARRFAPTLNVLFLNQDRGLALKGLKPFDVLVVSYGVLLQESKALSSLRWTTIVLDEAQAIKNISAKRTRAALSLEADFKLITTGTPIENRLVELHTLFHFLNPGLLGSRKSFTRRFADPITKEKDHEARQRLKRIVQPFILRRLKSAVLEELPPLTEITLDVEMGREETALYEALRQRAVERLSGLDVPVARQRVHILSEIMKLRRACCSPRLVVPGSALAGAKLEVFADVVGELRENRHNALVFSQFVGYLALVREYLDEHGISYCYLDGSTPGRKRQEQVEAFQAGEADLFLISLKAGGMGLNLTAADYVIHMDPWWNPAVEDQAGARAHRIGQRRPVTVYRLILRHTIEEKIIALHREKRDLADSLLEGTDTGTSISPEELLALIRD